jgi:DNA processing protein
MKKHLSSSTLGQISRLVERVAPEVWEVDSTETAILDAFARSAWSGVGEPGDRMVGLLCSALGASDALDHVIAGTSPGEIAQLCLEDESGSLTEQHIAEALARWRPRLSEAESIAHLERASRVGATLLTPVAGAWPTRMDDLRQHSPVALWARGQREALLGLERSVSIVGARASTGYGEHVTMELSAGLVDENFTIVSGAAYGIDGMAHRATLASEGATVAILAGGIDRLYPSGHDALLHKIMGSGVVLTELPCGFAPTKWRFLQRNRLIAAVSAATVVIEAGWRSGSLNTAHHALELDRPLGVVPGPITSASSAGCHRLLRETPATCVTSAPEIVELACGGDEAAVEWRRDGLTNVHPFAIRVLDALASKKARTLPDIAKIAGLSEAETMAVLGLLELNNEIREVATGWVKQSA